MPPARPAVAQILYSGLGGHGGVAFGIVQGDLAGHWTWEMGFLGIEPLLPSYAAQCERAGLECAYFPARSGKPWRSWAGIYRWLRTQRPSAIILHSVSAVIPCAAYARLSDIPLIVVEHHQNALKRRGEWMASRIAMLAADKVVVLTEDYARSLRTGLGWLWRPMKVTVIPNGIDVAKFARVKDRPMAVGSKVRIGMAARFSRTKRFDLLFDMLPALSRLRADLDWQLSVAGHGEEFAAVQADIARRGLTGSVVLEGMLDEDRLSEWYRGLDFYAHASDGETLSISVLQAMAAEVPVVASDVPGLTQLLGGVPERGILVENQTGQAFASAIVAAIDSPERTRRMAAVAHEMCLSEFDRSRMFDQYKQLIERARLDLGPSPRVRHG